MAALHLVNHAAALEACLALAAEDDAVLLLENGVYAASSGPPLGRPIHALEVDLRARGIAGRLTQDVLVIDDDWFVSLVEKHAPIITWRK